LDEDQKKVISDHITWCNNCKALYNRINLINIAIEDHIDDDKLGHYSIFKFHPNDTDFDAKRFSKTEINKIDHHLNLCNACKEKFIEKQSLYSDMNEYWIDSSLPDIELLPFTEEERPIKQRFTQILITLIKSIQINKKIRYSSLAAATTVLILVMFLLIERKPSINDLAKLDDINIPVSIRSGYTNTLQKGIILFNQKNYSDAIIQFDKYVETELKSNDQNYAKYLLGLSYIKSAEKSERINVSLVEKGIVQFNNILTTTDNSILKENVLWFLGKAYLMKKDIKKAMRYFESVNSLDGNRAEKSRVILNQLKDTGSL